MWEYSVPSDLIFDEDNLFSDDSTEIVDNRERNGFVQIRFHWKEDPNKDDEWYDQQVRDLNFDQRKINQELDLLFVGSTTCIFSDEFLGQLKESRPFDRINLPHACKLNIYSEVFDLSDFLIIGVDTAKSLLGDYNAIEVWSYANFIQVAEFFGKLGSLTKYSEVLMVVIKQLHKLMSGRILIGIENNSIGSAIIENLENASADPEHNFDYMKYVFTPTETIKTQQKNSIVEKTKIQQVEGINTNSKSKSSMVSFLYDYLVENPSCVKSSDFISQLNIIERRANGSISAQHGHHDDLFMAAALCAYVRRLSALEYEPLLGNTVLQTQQQHIENYKNVTVTGYHQFSNSKSKLYKTYNKNEGGIVYSTTDDEEDSLFDGMDELKSLVSIF